MVWREEQRSPYVASSAAFPTSIRAAARKAPAARRSCTPPRVCAIRSAASARAARVAGAHFVGRGPRVDRDGHGRYRRGAGPRRCHLRVRPQHRRRCEQRGAAALLPSARCARDRLDGADRRPLVGATITLGTAIPAARPTTGGAPRTSCCGRSTVGDAHSDAHFLYEGRYPRRRAGLISPDLSNSAIHADLWLSPRPGPMRHWRWPRLR